MAECAHASHTDSDPQAHSGTLRTRPEHAGDRAVFWLLPRGGASRPPAVSRTPHAGTPDVFMWTQDAAHRRAKTTSAPTSLGATRRHAGGVGCGPGSSLPYLHDRSLAAAAGLEV